MTDRRLPAIHENDDDTIVVADLPGRDREGDIPAVR
jgi:hypothetical protein